MTKQNPEVIALPTTVSVIAFSSKVITKLTLFDEGFWRL